MKWAHIINIYILFDCPPNKSHCSNKHKAPLHCLPLSGFELFDAAVGRFIIGTFPKWPISTVMDARFDCAKMALSLRSERLSRASWWAVLILSLPSNFSFPLPLPFFSHPSDGNRCESYPPKSPFHQEQTYSIIYWFSYLCTLWLLPLSPARVYLCFFLFFTVSARTYVRADDIYKRMHPRVSPARRWSVAEYRLRFSCLMPFHIVILRSRCNILLFRKANYQSSQLLLANFKALSTCCSFSFY